MSRPQTTLYTKPQVANLFLGWGCTVPIPGKGKKVVIGFAGQFIDLVEVEWTDKRSDCGDRLWAVTDSSAWGREIQRTICESHVLLWREEVMSRRREEKAKQRAYVLEQLEQHQGCELAAAEAIAAELSIPVGEAYSKVINTCL